MSFLNPVFLYFLPLSLFPVLLHLLGRRLTRRLRFPWVRLLFAVETEGRKRSRIYELLLLIVRCLAVACLILALSKPMIAPQKVEFDKAYLDVSMSMAPHAKEIRELYATLQENFPGREVRFFADKKLEIQRPVVTHRATDYGIIRCGKGERVLVVSDFQRGAFRRGNFSGGEFLLYKLGSIGNVALLSFTAEEPYFQPGEPVKLEIRVRNFGEEERRGRLKILGGDEEIAEVHLDLEGDAEEVFNLTVKSKSGFLKAIWQPGDSIPGDDTLYLYLPKVKKTELLVLGNKSAAVYLEAALKPKGLKTPFQLKFTENLTDGIDPKNVLIILKDRLNAADLSAIGKFLENGGKFIAFVADPNSPILAMLGLQASAKETGKLTVAVEDKVGFSELRKFLTLSGGKVLLRSARGDAVAVEKDGSIVVGFKPIPQFTEFVYSPYFAPWLHRVVLQLLGIDAPYNLHPGDELKLEVDEGGFFELLTPDGTRERLRAFVESGKAFVKIGPLETPGFYVLNREGKTRAIFVVNPEASESDVTPMGKDELRSLFGNNSKTVKHLVKGAHYLGRTFLMLTLLFLLLEIALLALRKHFFA